MKLSAEDVKRVAGLYGGSPMRSLFEAKSASSRRPACGGSYLFISELARAALGSAEQSFGDSGGQAAQQRCSSDAKRQLKFDLARLKYEKLQRSCTE